MADTRGVVFARHGFCVCCPPQPQTRTNPQTPTHSDTATRRLLSVFAKISFVLVDHLLCLPVLAMGLIPLTATPVGPFLART